MEEFLKTVARHYLAKVDQQTAQSGEPATMPFSRYLFCFPNRRSGLFFSRHLHQVHNEQYDAENQQPCCAPAMTTIDELYSHFSSRHLLDRTALLFRLFNVYDRCSKRRERETFDQFVFWGDMLLSDFDDVDKYLVDADLLFSNVRDLKEIEARFSELTPEQIAVIRSFWHNFRADREYSEDDKHEVFGQTWAILAQLYHEFRSELAAKNEAYSGMMEREVVERISQDDDDDPFGDFPYEKVVFVGLTAISKVDRKLMSSLKIRGMAEFCWDYADPRLRPDSSMATSAAFFAKSNLSDFGNEISIEELSSGLVPDANRKISLYSIASGVGQTQKAASLLNDWQSGIKDFDPLRTAVVLPDEKLLLPMLYAVPQTFESFNVTMGYGLKEAPIAAFVNKLDLLQQTYRVAEQTFYFQQVLPILSYPLTLSISNMAARCISDNIIKNNKYQVPISDFAGDSFLSLLFKPVNSAEETISYLTSILQVLMSHIVADVDYEFLYHYHKTLSALALQVKQSSISFSSRTLFLLLEKLVSGVSVPFKGEPLNGLQIMGVLETRSLDFDNVIILSMNEGVFPAKPSQNTFVPMSLRDAFGMPTQRHRDSVFAYHFYRMISRASRVALIYDSRAEGVNSGEESRYVKQLRYLIGYDGLKAETVVDTIGIVKNPDIVVQKTPEVMALLNQFLGMDAERNISASALKKYIECPLAFYLGIVRMLHTDDEVVEGVDSALFGDILHHALKDLYASCEGKEVQASMIEQYIRHPQDEITRCVHSAFQKLCNVKQLKGYNQLIAGLIVEYVVATLKHDKQLCPFVYLAGEVRHNFVFDAGNNLYVKIKCVYDRLDVPMSAEGVVRVVDYKTASSKNGSKLFFPNVSDLFTPDGKGSPEAFQVMMYALMLGHLSDSDLPKFHLKAAPQHVSPHLYFVRDFETNQQANTVLGQGTTDKNAVEVRDFSVFQSEFQARLSMTLHEIFNSEKPFVQCEEGSHCCSYCPFAYLCNRNN